MTTDTNSNVAPLPPGLDEPSALALAVIAGFKSFARAEYYARAGLGTYAPDSPPIATLVRARLVSVNRAGAIALTDAGRRVERTVPARYFSAVGGYGGGRPGYGSDSDDERAEWTALRARIGGGSSLVVRSARGEAEAGQ